MATLTRSPVLTSLRPCLLPMLHALAAAVAAVVLGLAAPGVVVPVAVFDWPNEEQRIPVAELLCVCAAAVGAWANRPRLWEWERLGGARTRIRAAAVSALGVLLSGGAALALLPHASEAENSWLLVTNVLLAVSAVYLLAPFLDAVPSGLVVLAGILLGAAACNTVPGLNRVSPYAYVGSDGWRAPDLLAGATVPALALGLALAAVAAHAVTHGSTARVRRRESETG
ncbi:hypothetical protein GCM10007079_06180 [Nocardiopsis terrae]|uniref:ABC transporter permease n=1 Tax=Nocardiopsis terrae TaxID=372655 RepID=A0ABR9HP65_9ACTN|nr:hypothetical protein [Nocardiopsis terrae]MBE1460665.1 hypothetical protein [Nocardiopsis terrae]GHC72763.1 hypothetical protein GCM10007079_06180 [Nocardiopsis terrae]